VGRCSVTLATAKLYGRPVYAYTGRDFVVYSADGANPPNTEEQISDCMDELGIETDEDLLALLVAVKDGAFGDTLVV